MLISSSAEIRSSADGGAAGGSVTTGVGDTAGRASEPVRAAAGETGAAGHWVVDVPELLSIHHCFFPSRFSLMLLRNICFPGKQGNTR